MVMLIAAFVAVPVCLTLWVLALDRVVQGRSMIPLNRRRRVPWTFGDIVMVATATILMLTVVSHWNHRRLNLPDGAWRLHELQPDQQVALLQSFSLTALASLGVGVLICRVRGRASLPDLGWNARRIVADLGWGIAGFFMLIVPMLSLHLAVQLLLGGEEQHPFIELIMAHPNVNFLPPIFFAAVVVAPITEEFFFRVLLQGWLERVAVRWERREFAWLHEGESNQVGDDSSQRDRDLLASDSVSQPSAARGRDDAEEAAMKTPLTFNHQEATRYREGEYANDFPMTAAGRYGPIVISSLAFSCAHVGQGAAPIALFLLALGLGYIYQQTHRIAPCIIVHFLVNLTAVVQLWLYVRAN